MTETTSVEEKSNKEKEPFVIIKSGLYTNASNSIVRLVPKEPLKDDEHKVKVLIFDEKNIPSSLGEEIAKDRGWQENLWKRISDEIPNESVLIQRKITESVKNPIDFDSWIFVSKKYFPIKKCAKTDTWFRVSDINQVVCPEYKETLLKELEAELATYAKRLEVPDCNISQLWTDLTSFKNRVIELTTLNHLSVRPYKNIRKEVQDVYNKAAQKRDSLKKEWEEKKIEKKKNLNDLLEEAKKINEISLASIEVSGEALSLLKNIRQKAKDLEVQGEVPPWGVQKLFSVVAPISKREEDKKQKMLEKRKEIFKSWKSKAKLISDQIFELNSNNENIKFQLQEFKDVVLKSKEKEEIGEREAEKLLLQIQSKLDGIASAKEKASFLIKSKEKMTKKLETASLKELYAQYNCINIGFMHNHQNIHTLTQLLQAADRLESNQESKKEEIEAFRKLVNKKIQTENSLKTILS